MAKEFDIYLRGHLVECDLLVCSIPYRDFISISNDLILEAVLDGCLLRVFAVVQTGVEVDAAVIGTLKHSLLNLKSAVNPDAEITQINQVDYIGADTSAAIASTLRSFCYGLSFDASAATAVTAQVLDTDILHPLGARYSGLALASEVVGTWARKFIIAESPISVMQEAVGTLTKALHPNNAGMFVETPALNIAAKRYRRLSEMDDLALAEWDNMTFGELDYVWLPE